MSTQDGAVGSAPIHEGDREKAGAVAVALRTLASCVESLLEGVRPSSAQKARHQLNEAKRLIGQLRSGLTRPPGDGALLHAGDLEPDR